MSKFQQSRIPPPKSYKFNFNPDNEEIQKKQNNDLEKMKYATLVASSLE